MPAHTKNWVVLPYTSTITFGSDARDQEQMQVNTEEHVQHTLGKTSTQKHQAFTTLSGGSTSSY